MAVATRSQFHALPRETFTYRPRKRNRCTRVSTQRAKMSSESDSAAKKRANLCARKNERIKLPNNGDGAIAEFFNHPRGIEAILNTGALQSYQSLDSNLYRCVLPQVQLLSFRVAPVLDLRVTPTDRDCLVEMLSCKFEGSEMVERQNKRFSASLRNCIKWESIDDEQFLEVDVMLNLVLEIYTRPFTLLPVSAVEGPGNKVMQALLDKLVPLLVQQLVQDYEEWVRQESIKSIR